MSLFFQKPGGGNGGPRAGQLTLPNALSPELLQTAPPTMPPQHMHRYSCVQT